MKNAIIFIFSISFLFLQFDGLSQSVTISEPVLKLTDNNVSIHYDILHSHPSEKFNISLEVTDEEGKRFTARSLSGDIGEGVSGGSGKEINWNLATDEVYLEAMLYFQVKATIISPENPSAMAKAPETGLKEGTASLSRSSVIIQSLLLPGLGLSRLDSKPHWIRGALGYGLLGSSVAFTINSGIKYKEYQAATNLTDRNNLFEVSEKQRNIANYQLYGALGVWVADFVWTLAGSQKLSKGLAHAQPTGIQIQPSLDTKMNVPMLALRYTF